MDRSEGVFGGGCAERARSWEDERGAKLVPARGTASTAAVKMGSRSLVEDDEDDILQKDL